MQLRLACVAAFAIVLGSAGARADVVDPEPPTCPAGSSPATAHSGPYCAPSATCDTDADCTGDARCEAVAQCHETRGCGGLMPPDAEPCTLTHVSGLCGGGAACASGTCETVRVCVAPGTSGGGSSGGCSCSAAGAGSAGASLAIGALIAAAIGQRRRRRRGSAEGDREARGS